MSKNPHEIVCGGDVVEDADNLCKISAALEAAYEEWEIAHEPRPEDPVEIAHHGNGVMTVVDPTPVLPDRLEVRLVEDKWRARFLKRDDRGCPGALIFAPGLSAEFAFSCIAQGIAHEVAAIILDRFASMGDESETMSKTSYEMKARYWQDLNAEGDWIAERDAAGPAPADDLDAAVDGAAAIEAEGVRALAAELREAQEALATSRREAAEARAFLARVNAAAEAERSAARAKVEDLESRLEAAERGEAWSAAPYYVAIAAAALLGALLGVVGTMYQLPV